MFRFSVGQSFWYSGKGMSRSRVRTQKWPQWLKRITTLRKCARTEQKTILKDFLFTGDGFIFFSSRRKNKNAVLINLLN